jgi:hypothetical protein
MRSVTGEPVSCELNAPAARKGQTMDSYIIRIYRRDVDRGRELAGLVERIGNGKRQAFGNSEELWAFLTDRQLARRGGAREKQSKPRR